MKFNFIEPEDENEKETIDLSDLPKTKKKSKDKRTRISRVDNSKSLSISKKSSQVNKFRFEDAIPRAKSITDKDVQKRAKQGRQRSISNMSYENKKEAGWSFYCSHKQHLPTLCERAQDNYEVTCTCTCHKERGYIQPEPKRLSTSDDEEIILLID